MSLLKKFPANPFRPIDHRPCRISFGAKHEHIPATVCKMNNDHARLWEIAENLHRAELTKLERDDNIAEWIKITERVSRQVDAKPQGGRPEGGVRAASRELGIDEDDGRRAVKVSSLSDEAKEAARETGLSRPDGQQHFRLEPEPMAERPVEFRLHLSGPRPWAVPLHLPTQA